MDNFETVFNTVLVETFGYILKYEEAALKKLLSVPVTITETHMIEMIGKQKNGETTVSKIASAFNIAVPTATVAIGKLERKGFVKKVSCEKDGRCTIISLTDAGRKIERAHLIFHTDMVKNISGQFADAEKTVLLRAARALGDYFKARVEAQ